MAPSVVEMSADKRARERHHEIAKWSRENCYTLLEESPNAIRRRRL